MIKNYFKTAWRNLIRNKVYSLINILGLSIGMAACILILLWVQNQVSHDQFHDKLDRIYVTNNRDINDGIKHAWAWTPNIMGPTLKKDYPEVEDAVRYSDGSNFLFTVGEKKLVPSGAFADPGFLSVFTFPLLKGNEKDALKEVHNIVLTEKLATSLFGAEDPMGKVVKVDSADQFTVTGVLKNLPDNTAFDFDYLLPWMYKDKLGWTDSSWGNNSLATYVLLKPGASHEAFDQKINKITTAHLTNDPLYKNREVFTQPFKDQWLYSKQENGRYTGGRIDMVRLFMTIAGLILIIACINFMNLSTARSEKRAKEVGIRKVVGAQKKGLIAQFIGESVLLSGIAFVFALTIVIISLPAFSRLVDQRLHLPFDNPLFWLFALGFILFSGALAGSYPAFYLSAFNPVKVLKGLFKSSTAAVSPRKVLVVVQFTFAVLLIISTIIVMQQIRHAQSRDNGYDAHNLVFVTMNGTIEKNYQLIRNELVSSGAAVAVTKSMSPITERYSDSWDFSWTGSTEEDKKVDFVRMASDADFVKTLGTKLVAGRDIDIYKYPGDSNVVLLNETAVRMMHVKDPLTTLLKADDKDWRVVGVVKDFIYQSPYEKVQQLIVFGPGSWFNTIQFKLNPANTTRQNLDIAGGIFKRYNSEYPFDYKFVDTEYARKFKEEQKTGTMAALFAGLTVFISCLGLFALSTYMAETRIKEIGVRKVLGASVFNITSLLSGDFLKLVIISCVVASPVAWFIMNKWLKNYDYRITIGWPVFAGTTLLVLVIALITVSSQAIRAAVANPVKALRSE
ncbi:ABC transporter permease [Niabella beijingensis]|uniref:ABC transporter permease n=1 Tax=Niabella beijingensis TaxID=2872700 RepID=UPI001CBC0D6C|nr:ABC transporter permease [Niabella beijingensis]MBZ4191464.1 ABC transporter permease [Niabella beijingensis]